jgi:O-acetyl-ADP-ribose deacetylase (regulator of RNase III)
MTTNDLQDEIDRLRKEVATLTRLARRNAFLEAANTCEAEIATGDPGTLLGAKQLRQGATLALETMARHLRRAAEHATPVGR